MKKQRLVTKSFLMRLGVGGILSVFLFTLAVVALPAPKARAASSGLNGKFTWNNRATIILDGGSSNKITFTDGNIGDYSNDFTADKLSGFCELKIHVTVKSFPSPVAIAPNAATEAAHGQLIFQKRQPAPANTCDAEETQTINISNADPGFNLVGQWVNSTTIKRVDGSRTYVQNGTLKGQKLFIWNQEKGGKCADYILVGSDPNRGYYEELTDSNNDGLGTSKGQELSKNVTGCWINQGDQGDSIKGNILLQDPKYADQAAGNNPNASAGTTDQSTNALECDNGGWTGVFENPLNWIICPLVNGLQSAFQAFDDLITNLLTINTVTLFNDPTTSGSISNGLYTAWSGFRFIAMGLLVIFALVMIISQAIGTGPFDAYTVKRVLPRLLAAVVLIALSWELMKFAISLSNGLGHSVAGLIYGPFKGVGGDTNSNGVALVATGGIIAGLAAIGPLGLLTFALTGVVAALTAVVVLVLREMIVIFLVVIAPVALVCNILPNTQRAWKMWSDYFMRALLLFPMFAGLVAVGRAFANIATQLYPGAVGTLVAFIAYVAPYFMLPALFRVSGGAIATLGGFVAGATAGMRGGLANYRKKQLGTNWEKTQNYERFGDRNKVARGLSTAAGAIANPRTSLKGRNAVRANRMSSLQAFGAATFESDKTIQANKNDDMFLLALANEDLANTKLSIAKRKFAAAQQSGDIDGMNSAQAEIDARTSAMANAHNVSSRHQAGTRLAALSALSATGYQFSPGKQGYQELYDTAMSITGGDQGAMAGVMNNAQFNLKNAGRSDLGGINYGAGEDIKTGIRKLSNYQRGNGKTDTYHGAAQAWLGASAVGIDGKTAKTSAELRSGIESSLANNQTNADDILQWHSMLANDYQSANDANKLEIQKQMEAIEGLNLPGDFRTRIDNNRKSARGLTDPNLIEDQNH